MDGTNNVQLALVRMMAIRGGERFQVITYSEDDGGADDKRDYASVTEAARAARDYVRDKRRWSLCAPLPVNTAPQSGSGTKTRWSVWPPLAVAGGRKYDT